MSFNINELEKVTVANLRGNSNKYDMAYSTSTERFRVTEHVYAKYSLDKHGFTLRPHRASSTLLLEIVPNDDAVMYKGKGGDNSTKGTEFKSNELRAFMDAFGLEDVLEFSLEPVDVQGAENTFVKITKADSQVKTQAEKAPQETAHDQPDNPPESELSIEEDEQPPEITAEESDDTSEDDILNNIV